MSSNRQSFSRRIREVFHRVYPATDYDPITRTFQGRSFLSSQQVGVSDEQYLNDPITMVTSALGIKNKRYDQFAPQSWRNIMTRNLLAWDSKKEKGFALPFYIFISGIILLLEATATVLNFATNAVKIFTEFLPASISTSLEYLSEKTTDIAKSSSWLNKVLGYGLGLTIYPFYLIANVWYFLGRAVTSPYSNLREIRHNYDCNKHNLLTTLLLGIASLSTTLSVLFALIPLAVKLGALYVFTATTNKLVLFIAAKIIASHRPMEVLRTIGTYIGGVIANKAPHALQNVRKGLHIVGAAFFDLCVDQFCKVRARFGSNHQLIIPTGADDDVPPPQATVFSPTTSSTVLTTEALQAAGIAAAFKANINNQPTSSQSLPISEAEGTIIASRYTSTSSLFTSHAMLAADNKLLEQQALATEPANSLSF